MSHSFTHLLYHLVWATKERRPCLEPRARPGLFACMGELVRDEAGIPLAVNGVADHVHLLVRLKQDRALSDTVRVIKARSSRWLHVNHPEIAGFGWQTGYSAFTVSLSAADSVKRYIENQEAHHRGRPYLDELRAMLKAHGFEPSDEDLRAC